MYVRSTRKNVLKMWMLLKMLVAVFLHYCFTAISCQCSKVRAINVGDGADQAV